MKVALASDVHLEFGPLKLENTENADVLILSGDIAVAEKFDKFMYFFEECAAEFKDVVYVFGNHEHYHGDYQTSHDTVYRALHNLKNVHLLNNGHIDFGDYTFLGGTLWTDMNKGDPFTKNYVTRRMNDFQIVKNSATVGRRTVNEYQYKDDGSYDVDENGRYIVIGQRVVEYTPDLSPDDVMVEHERMKAMIVEQVAKRPDRKYVVVGHHAPSRLSTKPRYQRDHHMNGAYSSDLSELILDHPQIKLWTHGHTHDTFDYMIGSTRILCNPRGYIGYESVADNFKLAFVDV